MAMYTLEQLNDLCHLLPVQLRTAERGVTQTDQVGLGGGQLGQGLFADVKHIPGVEALGHSAVKGVLANQVQSAPAQRVDLIADKNIPRADQRKQQLTVVMEVQPAHVPGLVMVQLQMKFYINHGKNLPLKK